MVGLRETGGSLDSPLPSFSPLQLAEKDADGYLWISRICKSAAQLTLQKIDEVSALAGKKVYSEHTVILAIFFQNELPFSLFELLNRYISLSDKLSGWEGKEYKKKIEIG